MGTRFSRERWFGPVVRMPMSHQEYLVSIPGSSSLIQTLEGSGDGSSNWILTIHMGDLD